MPTHPLLAIARTIGNPVIESDSATFIWQGKTAPILMDDFHNWAENPQTLHHAGADLWSCTIPLSADAYIEYSFFDPKTDKRILDPLNSKRVWNGSTGFNHYFYMPRSGPTPLVRPLKGIPRGIITQHQVPTKDFAKGKTRSVYFYQPSVTSPVPLLVVYDGTDYLKRGRLNNIVDNLIATNRVRPFAMAMVQNGGQARGIEYACSDATLGFIFDSVIPLAQEHLSLSAPGGEPYGVMGASLGGLMAMYTGMRLPKVFGKVLIQSGAFITPEHEFVVVDLVRHTPPAEISIWMDSGRYESLLDNNRQMYHLLKEKHYKVRYHEYSGAHNYTSWRDDVWRGLETLFR